MKCCEMHSGLLRFPIIIERVTETPDGAGGVTRAWAADPAGGVYAFWEVKKGEFQFTAERAHGDRLVSYGRYRAVIRFRGDDNGAPYYTSADRVLFRGQYYNIEAVTDADGGQRWLELALMLSEPS